MMIIPELDDMSVRICGFDPGSAHLGCAVLDWKWGDELPTIIWAGTLHAADDRVDSSMAETLGKRDVRMREIREQLEVFLDIAQPTFCCTETPFMQRGKLSAFQSGVEIQLMLRECIWEYSPRIFLNGINPKSLKNHLGVDHIGTEKMDVQVALYEMYKDNTLIDIMSLDEHASDACGACNWLYRTQFKNLPSLFVHVPKPKVKGSSKKRRRRRKRSRGK